ncbi:thiamine pyrophosphate-binding protein [Parahaliea maris]|uniref:Thiamine pyrophosphate-binding protein n=1 Tax=Parahaliea maris TaxID=2716870 RepID=A0A5C8ZQA4_9GAMM|nr:thiamine pyrophosphate-binding protein [Parahaliea maris]TXS89830.1 thiamine pyrophosphate-binding protein [Parahaliea maris]
MPLQTVANRIADLMQAEGITHLFSLPDVLHGRIQHALVQRGIPLIANHHECAGGHMAEAYSLLTGQTTAVGAARGPGVYNYYPAVANAWSEGRPVLFIGPEKSREVRSIAGRKSFQYVNAAEVLRSITKYSNVVEHPELVDAVFHEAFRQMYIGDMGPAYIGIPFDLLRRNEEYEFGPILTPEQYRPATFLGPGTKEQLDLAKAAIMSARRPVLLAGSGVYQSGMQDQFREFAEELAAPVLLTHGGQGLLPDTHPLVFEYNIGEGLEFSRNADLVIAIGTSIGDKIDNGGATPIAARPALEHAWGNAGQQRWIHIERDPENLGRNKIVEFPIFGDARQTLQELYGVRPNSTEWNAEYISVRKSKMSAAYAKLWEEAPDVVPMHPGRVMAEIQKSIPADSILSCGGGSFGLWAMRYRHHSIAGHMKSQKAGSTSAGMAYALAAGLKLRGTGKFSINIGGDGSFQFYLAEIETAVRYKLPTIFVVGYDQGWGDEVAANLAQYGDTHEVDHEYVRLDKVAEAMGAHGEYVATLADIAPAMQRALASNKPAVIQVVIDRDLNAFGLPDRSVLSGGRDWDHVIGGLGAPGLDPFSAH